MKYFLLLLVGAILGGGAAVYFLGAPRAGSAPGLPVKTPEGSPASTVVITLDQGLVDAVLATTFSGLGAPTFQLSQNPAGDLNEPVPAAYQGGCTNTITLLSEGSGVKTSVQFKGGKITAPIAFNGSYNLVGNCVQFKGWAQSNIRLSFDGDKQTVYGLVDVEGVNLEGVSPVANSFVTAFVQGAINQRVNPLVLVTERQLSLMIPVKASNGTVKSRAKDVRAEILDGALKLHVTYEFSGLKGQLQG
ncbi:MAG TPA: hypothetical protein VLA93_05990 [Pyrinomonadaceae bacterium]|nr:hypothetical protein [Pyrinomonadaceae bacterium]